MKNGRRKAARPLKSVRASNLKTSPPLSADAALCRVEGSGDAETQRQALDTILSQHWSDQLSRQPEFSSILGHKQWNDRLSDFSQDAIDEDITKAKDFLARLLAIDTEALSEEEQLNKTLLARQLRESIENARFKEWRMPVNPVKSIHLLVAQLASLLPFASAVDYEDFISRLNQVPRLLDELILQMKEGMTEGLLPPRLLLEKVVSQLRSLTRSAPEKTPFSQPLLKFPTAIPEASRRRIRERLLSAVRDEVLPAYSKLAQFIEKEYWPRARAEGGLWALPDGEARYAAAVRRATTTNLTPEEIHELGLAQVSHIEKQMGAIARQLKFANLKSFRLEIERNRRLRARSRRHILDLYRGYLEGIQSELHRLFERLPATGIEVRPIEAFREKEAPDAQYVQGTEDGRNPAYVLVNTGNPTRRKTISMEANAYHEGCPGHHLQAYFAREARSLPPFRQQAYYPAFDEGWGMYAELLGREVGFYKNPYSEYGRLHNELLRTVRLVIDTGIHKRRWTPHRAAQFFLRHLSIDEAAARREVHRSLSRPAQLLAYRIGQLKILELRTKAQRMLGDRFDIRRFHGELLGSGSLPLDILELRIDSWITREAESRNAF
jgi:uncharacterized protein (DUF885 family)